MRVPTVGPATCHQPDRWSAAAGALLDRLLLAPVDQHADDRPEQDDAEHDVRPVLLVAVGDGVVGGLAADQLVGRRDDLEAVSGRRPGDVAGAVGPLLAEPDVELGAELDAALGRLSVQVDS